MKAIDYLFLAFLFIGGFGMFLYGMNVMADGLQKSAGNKMKSLLGALTNNRFVGVLVGTAVTGIIQSSSATTVMVVGFVNAGLMNLSQAVGVIMGANIGTTVTAWIVSSSEWFAVFKPTKIAPLAVGVGAMMLFFIKNKHKRQLGEILVGFGLLFIGLEMMSGSITPFKDSEAFKNAFIVLGENPFLGILAGFAVTAIIQSSSVSVSILQVVAALALVPFDAAVFIILGQNIGTCVTAMLSSIGANRTAKRAAIVHLLFNVIGTLIFTVGALIFFKIINTTIGNSMISQTQISIFHTAFNLTNTILLFGFADKIVALSGKLVRGEDVIEYSEDTIALRHLDDRILETPGFAIENAIKEVVHMGELAIANSKLAIEALFEKDREKIETAFKQEKLINKLEKLITDYLIKMSNTPLNEHQNLVVTNLFHTVNDIESIGDHAKSIADLGMYYLDNDLEFSEIATKEIREISDKAIESVAYAIEARRQYSGEMIRKVEQYEEDVDNLEEKLRESHIRRLAKKECDSVTGVVFLDAINSLERMSDHALNIAYFVRDEEM